MTQIRRTLGTSFLMALMLGASFVFAQEEESEKEFIEYVSTNKWDFSATAGTFLPRHIKGVKETLPFWGFMFSHPSEVTQIEYGFLSGHAKGVTFYNGYISLRIDFLLADSLRGFLTIGPDFHYWKRKPLRTRDFPFRQAGGLHMGFGSYIDLAEAFGFRVDFKFNSNPGRSLYAGVGLIFRFGSSESQEEGVTTLREIDSQIATAKWAPEGEIP